MSDLELFTAGEGGESYDPAAFERFKEQMKKNAAFIAAATKSEQKQKQKEDRLAKILLKFIQTNQSSGILMLASRMLEENIPASFILSIIILTNEEIREEVANEIKSAPNAPTETFSLMPRIDDPTIPLRLKVEIEKWTNDIWESASAAPFRMLETALTKEGAIKQVAIDCAANVLDDYLAKHQLPEFTYNNCYSFCEFLMKGIMNGLQKQIENQKMVEN